MLNILKSSIKCFKPAQKQLLYANRALFCSANTHPNLLNHKFDHYNSVTLDAHSLPEDPQVFEEKLLHSMNHFNEVKIPFLACE